MSTTRTKMTGRKTVSIEIAAKKLKSELNAELIEESVCRLDDKATVILHVFEKYFMRNGSYAGLTVQLIENENLQIANIIASAGGEGIFNTVVNGPGKVVLQTMPASAVAGSIIPYIPSGN